LELADSLGAWALRRLADLLGQSDDDALGAADVTEPIAVLVLLQLANEFGAVGVQAGKDARRISAPIVPLERDDRCRETESRRSDVP
jgi:hypothetical protein